MKKGLGALFGMVLVLVFIIIALVGSWYSLSFKASQGTTTAEMNANLYLTRGEMRLVYPDTDTTQSTNYENNMEGKSAFDGAMYLTIIALVTGIITLIAIAGATFNFGNAKTMKKLGMLFGIVTFILALVAIIYFMISWGGALKDSELGSQLYSTTGGIVEAGDIGFFYSKSDALWDLSMGPGYAWYLMLIASIIALVSSILFFIDKPSVNIIQNQTPPVQ